ncbi:MAG: hypothetical protein M3269_01560 [Thermoproteota archaeon]|nr:hypothetical protein [Thermoproteota archaeon]
MIEAKLCFGAEAHQCIVEKAQSSNPTYNFQGIKLVSTKHTATIKGVLSISFLRRVYHLSINAKDEQSLVLPPCPRCRATMDLKLLEDFASRNINDEGRLYYCNNPICPPNEWERKHRLLPFSWNNTM